MTVSWAGCALLALALALFVAGANAEVVRATTSLARRLAPLENLDDVKTQAGIMGIAYVIQYLVLGGVFEGTHPSGVLSKTLKPAVLARRRSQVGHEIFAGIFSLLLTISLAIGWMYAGEPRTLFFAFFETHAWSPLWGIAGVLAYVACFDTWCVGERG